MKIIAILASYNEERFIRACLQHYLEQGVEVYLMDNESTDNTVAIAKEFLDKNVIGIETIPRKGVYSWNKILRRKEEIVDTLDGDWYMHADPDEIRFPPKPGQTIAEAIQQVDQEGYNAINFMEYTFLPVKEFPNHDTPNFQNSMQWYYPFAPRHPHRLNAWKKQKQQWVGLKKSVKELFHHRRLLPPSINLTSSGGHLVKFNNLKPYPQDFILKHYIVLSLDHAIQKYVHKTYDPKETDSGHGWRANAKEYSFLLPSQSQMRKFISNEKLDPSNPLSKHLIIKPGEE